MAEFSSNSVSFDPAVTVYDQTRLFLEPIARHGIPAILEVVGAKARILEVGAGTGRISIPLMERGANLVGFDLSAKMLGRLREKYVDARLAQGDAGFLPFAAQQFDAVLTVHVMHLIGKWRETLGDFQRVLMPGGIYLNVRTWETVSTSLSVREQVRQFWRNWVAAQGDFYRGHPGVEHRQEILAELQKMGASLVEVEVIRFSHSYTLREEVERLESRVYSNTWNVPDALFAASIQALRLWISSEYRELDQTFEDQVRFVMDVARFPS